MAPFQLNLPFEKLFSHQDNLRTFETSLLHWGRHWTTAHPEQEAWSGICLLWNTFYCKPIRTSICDCQHCLATTWAKWVFLHRLIKRHFCSLMSSSPCLSVGCVRYNHSSPHKLSLFLGLGWKGLLSFSLAGFCCHLLTSSATMLRRITAHNTYYYVHSKTVLDKDK